MANSLSPRWIDPPDERITEPELRESPAQGLPYDILIDIFIDVCEDTWLTDEGGPMLLIISSVCRFWRDITLGTPTLWTNIRWGDSVDGGSLPQLLELYVARSVNLPLHIHGTLFQVLYNHVNAESLLDVLIRHSNRWRTIDFSMPLSLLPKLNTIKGQIPLLESLALDTCYAIDGRFIVDCFECAPALKTLKHLYRGYVWEIRIPWRQLVDFTTNFAPLSNSLHDAKLCDHLTSLTLIDWIRFEDMDNFNVTLPFLRNLQLFTSRGSIRTSVLDVFSSITVPHLTSLQAHASHPDRGSTWKIPQFLGMVNRSQPFSLRSLDLRNMWLVAKTLIRCLEALPSLEALMIADFKRGAQKRPRLISMLIRRLIITTSIREPSSPMTPTLVPRLTALTLVGTFKDDHLVDMIKSRLRSSTVKMTTEAVKLKYVCLEYGGRSMSESTRAGIQHLVRTGIGLQVCIREHVPV